MTFLTEELQKLDEVTSRKSLAFRTKACCFAVIPTTHQNPSSKNPYRVCLWKDDQDNEGTFLVGGENWDLDYVRFVVGQTVELETGSGGLKAKPFSMQPRSLQDHVISCLEAGTPIKTSDGLSQPESNSQDTSTLGSNLDSSSELLGNKDSNAMTREDGVALAGEVIQRLIQQTALDSVENDVPAFIAAFIPPGTAK